MSAPLAVLDSYAILALVAEEPGAQQVADLLLAEAGSLFMSAINLGEVYYIIARRRGEAAAQQVIGAVQQEEHLTIVEASWPRIQAAARLKAAGGLSSADAFALGLAQELKAPMVTGDPELQTAASRFGVDLIWLG